MADTFRQILSTKSIFLVGVVTPLIFCLLSTTSFVREDMALFHPATDQTLNAVDQGGIPGIKPNKTAPPHTPNNFANMGLLFGKIIEADSQALPENAPVSTLEIILKGTFTNNDASKSFALIDDKERTARFFLNDEIAPGTILMAIYSGSVLIQRNDKHEKLMVEILKTDESTTTEKVTDLSPLIYPPRALAVDAAATVDNSLHERLQTLRANYDTSN